jgi:adenylate cyclase
MISTLDQKKDHGHCHSANRLMTITAILSMAWVIEVGARLQELTNSYIPAYGSLARTNIRSLERSLALRRSVIEEIQSPSSDKIADIRKEFDAKGVEGRARSSGCARVNP